MPSILAGSSSESEPSQSAPVSADGATGTRETARSEADFFKKMANDIIFESPQLEQLEYKARTVINALYNAIWENYAERNERVIRILPANVSRLIEAEKTQDGKARRICDFLAGQTDGMVVRTYRRLLDPEFGSFRDLS